jgi:hypothetical protein
MGRPDRDSKHTLKNIGIFFIIIIKLFMLYTFFLSLVLIAIFVLVLSNSIVQERILLCFED